MSAKRVLAELQAMGTAQNRKVYQRHGIGSAMFGVSYANLGKLKKELKTDHSLAQQLWASGNHDARVLATMIADPTKTSSSELDQWVRDLDSYPITDAFSTLAVSTPNAVAKMRKWMRSSHEWVGSAGWNMVARSAMQDDADVDEAFFNECLETIEAKIHRSKNRVRYSMNNALIAIGTRNARLEKKALAAAKRIGRVEVDHGETGCKTPDAARYIVKTNERARARKAGASSVRRSHKRAQ